MGGESKEQAAFVRRLTRKSQAALGKGEDMLTKIWDRTIKFESSRASQCFKCFCVKNAFGEVCEGDNVYLALDAYGSGLTKEEIKNCIYEKEGVTIAERKEREDKNDGRDPDFRMDYPAMCDILQQVESDHGGWLSKEWLKVAPRRKTDIVMDNTPEITMNPHDRYEQMAQAYAILLMNHANEEGEVQLSTLEELLTGQGEKISFAEWSEALYDMKHEQHGYFKPEIFLTSFKEACKKTQKNLVPKKCTSVYFEEKRKKRDEFLEKVYVKKDVTAQEEDVDCEDEGEECPGKLLLSTAANQDLTREPTKEELRTDPMREFAGIYAKTWKSENTKPVWQHQDKKYLLFSTKPDPNFKEDQEGTNGKWDKSTWKIAKNDAEMKKSLGWLQSIAPHKGDYDFEGKWDMYDMATGNFVPLPDAGVTIVCSDCGYGPNNWKPDSKHGHSNTCQMMKTRKTIVTVEGQERSRLTYAPAFKPKDKGEVELRKWGSGVSVPGGSERRASGGAFTYSRKTFRQEFPKEEWSKAQVDEDSGKKVETKEDRDARRAQRVKEKQLHEKRKEDKAKKRQEKDDGKK